MTGAARRAGYEPCSIVASMGFGEYQRCKRGWNCPVLIRWITTDSGQCLPIDEEGRVHLHKDDEFELRKYQDGYECSPRRAQCGCADALGIPLIAREARFESVEWPWRTHRCSRCSPYWDNCGAEFLARRCREIGGNVELAVMFASQRLVAYPELTIVGVKTIGAKVHCGFVMATHIPEAGSLVAWHAENSSDYLIGSGGQVLPVIGGGITPRNFDISD